MIRKNILTTAGVLSLAALLLLAGAAAYDRNSFAQVRVRVGGTAVAGGIYLAEACETAK